MAKIVVNESFEALGDQLSEFAESKVDELMGLMGRVAIMDFIGWAIATGKMEFNIVNGNATLEDMLEEWVAEQVK